MIPRSLVPLLPLVVLATWAPARADVNLPPVFSDHVVLQASRAVPVFGVADPGESVSGEVAQNFMSPAAFKATPELAKLVSRHTRETSTQWGSLVAPLLPYGIRGVLWYQGEGNRDYPVTYQERKASPWEGKDCALREAQLQAVRSVPKTALIVTIDLGIAKDVHYPNKAEIREPKQPRAEEKFMSRRDEEKKRRRQKRLARRQERTATPSPADSGQRTLDAIAAKREEIEQTLRVLNKMQEEMRTGPPMTYPGACDPSLDRPDELKYELGMFATSTAPGAAKLRELQQRLKKGLLRDLPNLDDWAMEELVWHGLPGDSWNAVEAFLEHAGTRFPPAAREQLRRWKEARIGLFQIGEVANDTVGLQEWDPARRVGVGPPIRAITLNISGVNVHRSSRGRFLLTHLAPWRPEDGLYCGLGYGMQVDLSQTAMAANYLGLRQLEVAATPLPWEERPSARSEYLRLWRQREWHSWLAEQIHFPFFAFLPVPARDTIEIREVRSLLPSSAERARKLGIYFEAPSFDGEEIMAAGGTAVVPMDIGSVNRRALAEYQAYRKVEGPPPGTRGMPASAQWR